MNEFFHFHSGNLSGGECFIFEQNRFSLRCWMSLPFISAEDFDGFFRPIARLKQAFTLYVKLAESRKMVRKIILGMSKQSEEM